MTYERTSRRNGSILGADGRGDSLARRAEDAVRYRLTGIGGLGFSLNWDKEPGDREVAVRVVRFLEDRRLLFGDRHYEDGPHCVRSALEIRHFLTSQLAGVPVGKSLSASLQAMRSSCRKFIESAGHDGRNFTVGMSTYENSMFALVLGDLRSMMGVQIDVIARKYDIEVDEDLARILPPEYLDDDSSWLPGFADDDS